MASFGNPKHKFKKLWNLHNIFELKTNFDPTVRWGRLDKINVYRV
jgi:hypothetical protein